LSGSAQVQIATVRKRGEADQQLTEQSAKRVQRRLQEAILKYLQTQSSATQAASLQFGASSAQQRMVASTAAPISVSGGNPPWIGAQTFMIAVDTAEGPRSFSLDVRVNPTSMVVAAVHSLPRGAIVQTADLALVHEDPRDDRDSGGFRSIEEAVGKQTTKAIVEGKILTMDDVRAPLMVRRSEVVTVFARSAGIQIHTSARAKDDGAQGDLVAVESLADRKTFTARVCGPRETEVFAQAASAK
jgi:flagella basal body P-ring formation protein FlgA